MALAVQRKTVVVRFRVRGHNFPVFRYPWIAIRLESISNRFYMHGWKLSRCVNVNQLLIERAISHLCPCVEILNIILQSKLNEKLVFSRLIKVTSLTMFYVPNLVPRAFLCRGEEGREKTLASADHVIFKHPEKLGVIN